LENFSNLLKQRRFERKAKIEVTQSNHFDS